MEHIDERGSRAPFYFSFAPPAHSLKWRNKNQKLTKKRNQEGRRRNFLASNSVTSVLSKSSGVTEFQLSKREYHISNATWLS